MWPAAATFVVQLPRPDWSLALTALRCRRLSRNFVLFRDRFLEPVDEQSVAAEIARGTVPWASCTDLARSFGLVVNTPKECEFGTSM
jgi:hypothetical protein